MAEKITQLEEILDVRNGGKSPSKFQKLKAAINDLEGPNSIAGNRLYDELSKALSAKGVLKTPFPGMLNGDYYLFAKSHPHLVADAYIFALLWLSSRLAEVRLKYIYYSHT